MIEVDLDGMRGFLLGVSRIEDELEERLPDLELDVAGLVVKAARPLVPVVSGAARRSVRVRDFSDGAAAVGGSSTVEYFAWLSFGGRAGIRGSVVREVVPEGRYLHPAFEANLGAIQERMTDTVMDAVQAAGLG